VLAEAGVTDLRGYRYDTAGQGDLRPDHVV
jgi:hypothetical protein